MKPVHFQQANSSLGAPQGMERDCDPLPVFTDGNTCTSLWELTEEERAAIAMGGRIWLVVYSGATQPPVGMAVEDPMQRHGTSSAEQAFPA